MYGTVAGILFGLSSSLTKPTLDYLHESVGTMLSHWECYALAVAAVLGFVLQQVSLGTGRLAPSVATVSVANPIVGILIGILLFDERLSEPTWHILLALVGLALALGGAVVISLARESAPAAPDADAPGTRRREVIAVIYTGAQVLFYALCAALSPMILAATFLVLRSERPRRNGIAFLSGFVIGTAIACVVGLVLGDAFVERLDAHDTFKSVVTLGLGLVLIAVGLQARHAPPQPEARSSRAAAILATLGNVGPAATFSMAGLLGFGGPKRLVLTLLAMTAVSQASLRNVVDLTLVALYIAVATVLVSVPVVLVIIAGEHAAELLGVAQTWLAEHATVIRVWLSLTVGVALVIDGLLRMLV